MNNRDFNTFERLLRLAYNNITTGEEILSKNPRNYNTMLFEDEYVDNLLQFKDQLFDELFNYMFSTHDMECANWFLWEWNPGYEIVDNGKTIIINDIEDYLKFKKETWNNND